VSNQDVHLENAMISRGQGDWVDARQHLAQALASAQAEGTDSSSLTTIYFEYGRALGATCSFDEAEQYLLRAMELEQQASGPVHRPLLELARLHYDQQRLVEAASEYERLMPMYGKIDAATHDPIGFADLLSEYSVSLGGTGRSTEAKVMRKRAEQVRAEHPGESSKTDRTPYGKHCAQSQLTDWFLPMSLYPTVRGTG
jgi:tetratricopeptide (TPR) repeat protein